MAQAAAKVRVSAPPVQLFDLSKAKVLIVDDNPRALEILTQVLLGFCVRNTTQCCTFDEAAPIAESVEHDLIIVDGEMPEKDGFDLTHHVRANPTGPNFCTPIILVSGYTPKSKVTRARDIGANAVVTKPIIPSVLLNRIEVLARRPRQFISSPGYCGPDRRFHNLILPEGQEERRAESIRLMAEPERDLSQDDIDSLFG